MYSQESKCLQDEVSPSIRDFIINFRKQQAQLEKQYVYQQSIKKTIPIKSITQLKLNRQSVDTQTDLTEQQQSDTSFKRNSLQISQRQNSTYSQSYFTTREVQCDDYKTKPIDDLTSTRVNFNQLHQHYQSIQQSERTTQNTSQQIPLIYRSPQKNENEINYDQMTEQILNKVIQELDKRNTEINQYQQQQSNSRSLSNSKMNNLSINNQTVSLTVIPQPKNEDDDSFLKFIQMTLVKKNKIYYEEQENQPPQKSSVIYFQNIPNTREKHSKSSISKSSFSESLNQNRVIRNQSNNNKNMTTNKNVINKSNAHQRLYQDACMRQERKTMFKKSRY
ncbi:unnamed protein product [Paramecium pentaurelia]|uniref:Uncharacterized protein n=1 Tax=Paramecium pentaurelia TaxID=43138 RepID=A0A8S1TTL5_9CILI|nr:unnamed protein product [Paramecium pentaurelia]